jgi:hypothetical protein
MKKILYAKYFPVFALVTLLYFTISPSVMAAGLFGAPQTVSREAGGLNTAIGYRYHEDIYENGADIKIRQTEIYSQVAYGAKNIWEVYGRVGMSDLNIEDVFKDNEKFSGTLGAKAFYPISKTIGVGAFVQGTYYFSDFTDTVSRNKEIKVKNLWDINCGVGFQAALPRDIKLYAGPYIYYSEAQMSLSSHIPGLEYTAGNFSIKNKSIAGGFAGLDIPLIKGFRLNVEGQYSDRFSTGAAVSYTY